MKKPLITFCLISMLIASSGCSKNNSEEMIVISEPEENAQVECPLHIEGEARGSWYFEGSFPVKLINAGGEVIAEDIAIAEGEWMTEEFVPFSLDLDYETNEIQGTLVFQKDNPSGLPENDAKKEIPVYLGSCTATP